MDAQPRRPGWVYFAYAPEMHRCKIGWTSKTPQERFSETTDNPDHLNIWGMLLANSDEMEGVIHDHFNYLRIKGEWFAVDDCLRNFVQYHTYKKTHATSSYYWKENKWGAWDRLAGDKNVKQLIGMCQTNPVELIHRYKDPLIYFYNQVKPFIVSWVGYDARFREDEFFKTSLAYDVVYEMCVDLLPC
jgi:hypothetical protein